jgi:hypothetical protein
VALVAGEGLREERPDDRQRLLLGVLAAADRHDLGVVVLAREPGGVQVPGQGGADALDLVRGDLLAVARPAQDDPEGVEPRVPVRPDGARCADAERGVVVEGVVLGGAVVDEVVAGGDELLDQVAGEVQAGVVGGDVDAHGRRAPGVRVERGGIVAEGPRRRTGRPPA